MTDAGQLISLAEKMRQQSYTPYSGFAVGAALLCHDGTVYTGCNIENASFTPTVCAERVAVFKAVSEGHRDFSAIAIVGGSAGSPGGFCAPCGVCRQVLSEFCDPAHFTVYLMGKDGSPVGYRLSDLLPLSFGKNDLNGDNAAPDNTQPKD